MPMGFARHPGELPFVTIRDRDKWAPRLTNRMIEIVGEGCDLPLQMARVVAVTEIHCWQAEAAGYYVPAVYGNRPLIAVWLDRP